MLKKPTSPEQCTNYGDSLKLALMAASMRQNAPLPQAATPSEPCKNYKSAKELFLLSASGNDAVAIGFKQLRDASSTLSAALKAPKNNM